jgi:hemerythrin
MAFYEWTERLDVHVPAMNSEHKELIRLMNELFDKNEAGATRPELTAAVDALAKFTVKHFEDEEAHMAKIGFEGLETHKIIHQQLLTQFTAFVDTFEKSGDAKIDKKFFDFLSVWLTSHIKGIDTKYGAVST